MIPNPLVSENLMPSRLASRGWHLLWSSPTSMSNFFSIRLFIVSLSARRLLHSVTKKSYVAPFGENSLFRQKYTDVRQIPEVSPRRAEREISRKFSSRSCSVNVDLCTVKLNRAASLAFSHFVQLLLSRKVTSWPRRTSAAAILVLDMWWLPSSEAV